MDFICEAFDQMQRAFDLNGFNDHQLQKRSFQAI
jgi:hypothetical protein